MPMPASEDRIRHPSMNFRLWPCSHYKFNVIQLILYSKWYTIPGGMQHSPLLTHSCLFLETPLERDLVKSS